MHADVSLHLSINTASCTVLRQYEINFLFEKAKKILENIFAS